MKSGDILIIGNVFYIVHFSYISYLFIHFPSSKIFIYICKFDSILVCVRSRNAKEIKYAKYFLLYVCQILGKKKKNYRSTAGLENFLLAA